MFPNIRIRVKGLDPIRKYSIFIDVIPCSEFKYKFINSKWVAFDKSEPELKKKFDFVKKNYYS